MVVVVLECSTEMIRPVGVLNAHHKNDRLCLSPYRAAPSDRLPRKRHPGTLPLEEAAGETTTGEAAGDTTTEEAAGDTTTGDAAGDTTTDGGSW